VAVTREANGSTPVPSPDDVRGIAAIANPVIRNLEITYCYARQAAAFAARSGEGANWCTFATWASRQAGRTIRGEDLLEELERSLLGGRWLLHPIRTLWRRLLRRGLLNRETRLGRLTSELHTPFDAFERASEAVARGNQTVFEEVGFEFARYLDECSPQAHDKDVTFQHFVDRLRPGEPPDGQRYLRQAFTHYEQLLSEPDPKARAELAMLANLEIGLHEQTRLQSQIREALDAAYATNEDLGRRALEALFPSAEQWWPIFRRPAGAVVGAIGAGVQRVASRIAREVISECFMTLALPGRVLSLGVNLTDSYPDVLQQPELTELTEFLARFEPVFPERDDCGARDWSEFHQRMHYIVHLFRVFHLRAELCEPPFTAEQIASFERGVVPDGEL
jgi:hypothetical protein